MFPKSIRWRWQLWLAFLLIGVLSGFGVAVYQLQRVNQLKQIDEELERRLAALSSAVRGGRPPGFGPRRPREEGGPGEPAPDDAPRRLCRRPHAWPTRSRTRACATSSGKPSTSRKWATACWPAARSVRTCKP